MTKEEKALYCRVAKRLEKVSALGLGLCWALHQERYVYDSYKRVPEFFEMRDSYLFPSTKKYLEDRYTALAFFIEMEKHTL